MRTLRRSRRHPWTRVGVRRKVGAVRAVVFSSVFLTALGCAGNGAHGSGSVTADTDASAIDAGLADPNATVAVFDRALFAFGGSSGSRRQTVSVAFPRGGTYGKINLHVALDCPVGGCDVWDRAASLGVVTELPVDGGSHGLVVEVARWITPYGIAAAWDFDVTDLAPLLTGGMATIQGFIDTFSPQGNAATNGAGWLLTATFAFTAGSPANVPLANIPIWPWPADSDPDNSAQYGDSTDPVESHLPPRTISLPPKASSYKLRTFLTGHGQGNTNNCAEFCMATHTLSFRPRSGEAGGTCAEGGVVKCGDVPSTFTFVPWRECCTPFPVCQGLPRPTPAPGVAGGQRGTYMYSRAGWCPRAAVNAWEKDVTAAVGSGDVTISYGVDSYANTCRPDDAACQCDPGAAGAPPSCAFDSNGHTRPFFYVSSLLVAY